MKRFNTKGQDLSIGTLILIVLGIVVLVLLILGFSMGWQDLFTKINIFSGGSNLESVAQACNLAADSQATISYCSDFKKVKDNGKTVYANCEYSKIQTSLRSTLSCSSPTADRVKAQCLDLINAQKFKDRTACDKYDIWVNDVECKTHCSEGTFVSS